MFFSGETSRRKLRLGGQSRSEESRDQVLNRTRIEREQRRQQRLENTSATSIQAAWRGHNSRSKLRRILEQSLFLEHTNGNRKINIQLENQPYLSMFLYVYDPKKLSQVLFLYNSILCGCDVINLAIDDATTRHRISKLASVSLDTLSAHCGWHLFDDRKIFDDILGWLQNLIIQQNWICAKLVYRNNGIDALYNMIMNRNGDDRMVKLLFQIVSSAIQCQDYQEVGKGGKVRFWKLFCDSGLTSQLQNSSQFSVSIFVRVIKEVSEIDNSQQFYKQFQKEQQAIENGVALLGNLLNLAHHLLPHKIMVGWKSVGANFCRSVLFLLNTLPIRQLLQHQEHQQSISQQLIQPLYLLQDQDILHWIITNSFPYIHAPAINKEDSFQLSQHTIITTNLLLEILRCEELQIQVRILFSSQKNQFIRRLWFSGLRQSWWQSSGLTCQQNMDVDNWDWIEMFGLWAKAFSTYVRSSFDDSFYVEQNSFPLEEIYSADALDAGVLAALKFILIQNSWLQKMGNSNKFVASQDTLNTCTQLFIQLYERNSRREFCPREAFHSKAIVVKQGVQDTHYFISGSPRDNMANILDARIGEVLKSAPFLIAFEDRVKLFRSYVEQDRQVSRQMQQDFINMHGIERPNFVQVRRDRILDDGFDQLNQMGHALKQQVRIAFVDEHGMEEAGVDGGGLFKDFLEKLLVQGFNSSYGLFISTSDNQLYPNPSAPSMLPDALKLFAFLGRMLGKALYEGIIVELPFAQFFLKKMLQMSTDINDMTTLDAELYNQLVHLSRYSGNVEDLCLSFSVSVTEFGEVKEIDLIPNGRNISVTNGNVLTYMYHMSDFKLRRQIHVPTQAFFQGFFEIIDPQWVTMFSAHELHMLIAGSSEVIDIQDMQRNTHYTGGYHLDHPVIKLFWDTLLSFTALQQRQVLRFVTACSRAPLLGFQYLQPQFCIQMAASDNDFEDRLPTASTCINLLKLPPYQSQEQMSYKLLYAVQQTEGFGLS